MKVVYIAGPFRGRDSWAVEQNIRRAEELAFEVASLGAAALCPHANTRFFNGTLTDDYWLASTMEMLRRCDALVTVSGWKHSVGARAEVEEASRRGILAFHEIDDLAEWLRGTP